MPAIHHREDTHPDGSVCACPDAVAASLHESRHGAARRQQRGFSHDDIAMLIDSATQISPDAYLMRKADAEREIARRKREIQRLERLKGSVIVVSEGRIVTMYRQRGRGPRRGASRRIRRGEHR